MCHSYALVDGVSRARRWARAFCRETSIPVTVDKLVDFHTGGDTQKLVRELSRSCSLGSELSLSGRKPNRFRAAARRVIAEKRLSTVDSDPSGSRKED